MSEDNRGCGSTVAAGVVFCAIIFNWFGAGELASGIFQGAGKIVSGIARGLSSGSSAPSSGPNTRPSTTIDQRLVGSWTYKTSQTNWTSISLWPSGWRQTTCVDRGLYVESFVQQGGQWHTEAGQLILINESAQMEVGRHDGVTGESTKRQQAVDVRQLANYAFDSYGRLLLRLSGGTVPMERER